MVVTPPNTNRPITVQVPPIRLTRYRLCAGSCREALLAALTADVNRRPRTAAEMHITLKAGGAMWSAQTIYKTMRRMRNDGILDWQDGHFQLTAPG